MQTGTGSTPEPSSLVLLGSGIIAAVGVLRRRLFQRSRWSASGLAWFGAGGIGRQESRSASTPSRSSQVSKASRSFVICGSVVVVNAL